MPSLQIRGFFSSLFLDLYAVFIDQGQLRGPVVYGQDARGGAQRAVVLPLGIAEDVRGDLRVRELGEPAGADLDRLALREVEVVAGGDGRRVLADGLLPVWPVFSSKMSSIDLSELEQRSKQPASRYSRNLFLDMAQVVTPKVSVEQKTRLVEAFLSLYGSM